MKYKQRIVIMIVAALLCFLFLSVNHLPVPAAEDGKGELIIREPDHRSTDHVTDPTMQSLRTHKTLPSVPAVINSLPPYNQVHGDHYKPWTIWSGWVQPDALYPDNMLYSEQMNVILSSLATYPVTLFDVGYKGTQLKASMYLSGNQRAVFKPMRFARDAIIDGPDDPCKGGDRHNGEIASFHLESILGYRLAPPVVGRRINLTTLLPVTSKALRDTYTIEGENMCFYGKCLYCKPEERVCANRDIMEGSVTIWLPDWYQLKTWRHPYQRTYVPDLKARWETDDQYCVTYLLDSTSLYYHLLPDIFDTMAMDFLIGNADRHHFETYAMLGNKGHLMHIDNGKSFGNPYHDEMSILTPLRQCCKLRNSTWLKLKDLREKGLSQILDKSLQRDPLYPILTKEHLTAIDRRLDKLLKEIEKCINEHGQSSVLFNNWEGTTKIS